METMSLKKEKRLFAAGGAAVIVMVAAVLLLVLRFPETTAAAEPVFYPKAAAYNEPNPDAERAGEMLDQSFVENVRGFSADASAAAFARGEKGENSLFSPLSFYYALAMCAESAGGDTRSELLDALRMGDGAGLRENSALLFKTLYTDNAVGKLKLANSVWLNEQIGFHSDTQKRLARDYFASLHPSDFTGAETSAQIAAWVAENTGGHLGGDPRAFALDSDAVAVLINTLYFKDEWEIPFVFDPAGEEEFHLADGETLRLPFMEMTRDEQEIVVGERWKMSTLSFKNGASMVFVLPEKGVSVEELLRDGKRLAEILAGGKEEDRHNGTVAFRLPKFSFQSSLSLRETAESMGIRAAFDPGRADFSALTASPAFLSEILQEAFISVDENGCEAAAFTEVLMCGGARMGEAPEKFELTLDRPFAVLIQRENLPLFIGVVNTPS